MVDCKRTCPNTERTDKLFLDTIMRKHTRKKESSSISNEVKSSSYYLMHMPEITQAGELLLSFASCHTNSRKFRGSHDVFRVTLKIFVIALTAHLISYLSLPARYQQLLYGINLLISNGIVFFLGSLLLTKWELTNQIGELLVQRVICANENWVNDPLRSFLEVCCWLGCVLGSYVLSQSYILSILGGSIAGMLGASTGDMFVGYIRYVEKQIEESEQQHQAANSSKFVLLSMCIGYLFLGVLRIVWELFSSNTPVLAQDIHNLSMSYLLILLVGISLVVASELFMLWMPTRWAGKILQSRLIHAGKNWEKNPSRAIIEIGCTFIIMFLCYRYFHDVVISIQCGTFSAIVVVLICETFSKKNFHRRDSVPIESDHWIKLLPIICAMGYVGIRIFYILFHNAWNILIAVSLSLVLSAFVILVAQVLLCWNATRQIGLILKDRVFNPWNNLNQEPLRTTLECGCLLGVTYGSFVLYHDLVIALEIGFLSGISVVLSHEYFKAHFVYSSNSPLEKKKKNTRFLMLFVILLVGTALFNTVYTHLHCITTAGCIATIIGMILTCFTQLLMNWKYTYMAESILFDRWINIKVNWKNSPSRSYVELSCWFGVFLGTYVISYDLLLSSLFATLSGIVVTLTGEIIRQKLSDSSWIFLETDFHQHVQASSNTFISCITIIFLITYGGGLVLYFIYQNIRQIEIAFVLATFSGVAFISASELFLLWKPSRTAGNILQERLLNASSNWKNNPERSIIEIGCWLGVTYVSYACSHDFLLSLQFGTFSAILVTLSGEYLSRHLSSSYCSPRRNDMIQHQDRPKLLPFILLLGYVGSGTFNWIFVHFRKIEITFVLASITGISLVAVADLLVSWKPTKTAGIILQERLICVERNWKLYPLRSFVELGCWLGVIYGSYAIYGDLFVAVQFGTFSGMLVTLMGELVKNFIDPLDQHNLNSNKSLKNDDNENDQGKVLPLPLICIFGIVGILVFNTIYTHLRSIEIAFVLSTLTGIAMVVAGDIFVIWSPTRMIGMILQQRIIYLRDNIENHTKRTFCEFIVSSLTLWFSFSLFGDLFYAIQMGTVAGILACIAGELLVQNLRSIEKELESQLCVRQYSSQVQATLLDVPYEILFEIGRFLTPKELLVTRVLCHRVKDMLQAEAARYWLHVSLRKNFRRGLCDPWTNAPAEQPIRCLVFDAFRFLKNNLFYKREPCAILDTESSYNRPLRWVYMNAEWIRKQGLPFMDCKMISLNEGDIGYDVFRYIPDKESLDIVEKFDEEVASKTILVPYIVYHKIQEEPLTFVASATLSEVEDFSNWHLIFVGLFSMVVICVSKLISDLANQIFAFSS